MFPPGRAKFVTKPPPTGSETTTNTIGIVCVAFSHNRSRRIGPDDNDVWCKSDQLLGAGAHPFRYLVCETVIKPDVAAFIPAKFVKTLPERRKIVLHQGPTVVRKGYQYTDAPQAPCLLRARRERPDDRDALRSVTNSRRLIASPRGR